MERLAIYDAINKTRTVDQLKKAIVDNFGENGEMNGLSEMFSVVDMLRMIDWFVEDYNLERHHFRALPTRNYGIRQQLCYILMNPTRI